MEEMSHWYGMGVLLIVYYVSKIEATFFILIVTSICEILFADLTHWCWDKMSDIFQTAFSNAFSRMKMVELRTKFEVDSLAPVDNHSALVQKMAWRWTGNKPLSEPMTA